MYNYKIPNKKEKDIKCILVDNGNEYISKELIFIYDYESKEMNIQISPIKSEKNSSTIWDIESSEYLPFIEKCTIYDKKKSLEKIENIKGIHIAKCENTIFIISSNVEKEF